MTISGRFTLLASLTAIFSALILLAALIHQDFEHRKALWLAASVASVSANTHWQPALHFRNDQLIANQLQRLALDEKVSWVAVQHVDGEALASRPAAADAPEPALLERLSNNRLEALMGIHSPAPQTMKPHQGALAVIPLMDRLLVLSVPVYTAVDPLRTDITFDAYLDQIWQGNGSGSRYVSGYIEQGIFLGDFLWMGMEGAISMMLWVFIVLLIILWIVRVQARSLNAPLLHMARIAEAIDAEEIPLKIDPPAGTDEDIARITRVLNRMVEGLEHMQLKLDVDRSLMSLRADSTTRKLSKAEAEVHESRQRVRQVSYFDPVTGLANRRLMLEHLSLLIRIAARERRHLGLVLLDLSGIDKIQKAKGREAADTVLRQLATRLVNTVRDSDIISHDSVAQDVARFDSDEFCVIMHGIYEPEGALAAAQRLLTTLEEPVQLGGEAFALKSYAGIAIAPIHARNPEDLVRAADVALAAAKESNHDQPVVFNNEMDQQSSQRFQIEADLRSADFDREFYLVYQPQIEPKSGEILGMEALLRWRHPERGEISPANFISIAEQTGQIQAVGDWVLRRACADFSILRHAHGAPPRVSVNISSAQLNESFVSNLAPLLEEYEMKAEALGLELTESVLVETVDSAASHLNTLHNEIGVHLSVDDFGTGYSSLAYLSQLPIDELKVDRSFVLAMKEDASAAQLTRAIIAIGDSLGLSVIIEGVETAEQMAMVEDLGAHGIQGYFFSEPLTLDELKVFLASAESKKSSS